MNDSMNWLNHEHLDHELLLQDYQAATEKEDWKGVKRVFEKLVTDIKVHMLMEEKAQEARTAETNEERTVFI